MADERSLHFGITYDVNETPLDQATEAEKKAKEEAKKLSDELDKIGPRFGQVGSQATSAFNGVKGASTSMGTSVSSAMMTSIRGGNNLIKIFGSGIGAAVGTAAAKIKGFGAATGTVAKTIGNAFMHPIQTIKANLADALTHAGKEAKGAGEKADGASKDFEKLGSRGGSASDSLMSKIKKLVAVTAGLMIIGQAAGAIKGFANEAINAAAAAEETQSKFEVVFKDNSEGANQWVANFAGAANRSKNEVRGFMADAQAFLTGAGMDTGAASEMSKQLTSLSYDLASFHNLSDEDAFSKLRSGMLGETQGLKTMGIVLNETALKQSMQTMGIKKNFDKLDESTKAQVRLNAILAQTKDAQTDVTRTSDSYTNSLKGIKGMYADFLGDAGAKFTPILTRLFNVILQKWPVIEPMLMKLVDILAVGLEQAVPILLDLGETLLPVLTDAIGTVLEAMLPLMPLFGALIKTLLPPLASLIATLATTLLPPLTEIFTILMRDVLQPLLPIFMELVSVLLPPFVSLLEMVGPILQMISPLLIMLAQLLVPVAGIIAELVQSLLPPIMTILQIIFNDILMPLMPIIQMLVETLLPPLAALLGAIGPLLQAIAPVLQLLTPLIEFIGAILGKWIELIAKLIGWVTDGVGKVTNFFSSIFGGAKESSQATGELADSMKEVTGAAEDYKPIDIPPPAPLDMSAYKTELSTAPSALTTATSTAMTDANKLTQKGMGEIGSTATDTFGGMAKDNGSAWQAIVRTTESAVREIIAQFNRLRSAADATGGITIGTTSTAGSGAGRRVPHNKDGDPDFPGGWTYINEGGDGELAYLPGGSAIIPADKSERLIANTNKATKVFAPNIKVEINGKMSEEDRRETEAYFKKLVRDAYVELADADADEEAAQEALA